MDETPIKRGRGRPKGTTKKKRGGRKPQQQHDEIIESQPPINDTVVRESSPSEEQREIEINVDAVAPEVPILVQPKKKGEKKFEHRRSHRFNILTVEILSGSEDEDGDENDDFCIVISQPNIYASVTTKKELRKKSTT
jgi:hypothetical protein